MSVEAAAIRAASQAALLGLAASATALAVREHHSHGESYHLPAAPDLVCFPASTAEVSQILEDQSAVPAAGQSRSVPGTSLEGHVHALRGGISIDLREMKRVLRVSAEDLDATVEAGVTRKQLNAALRNTGLMFPVDPGADATIGGMASTRASGTTAVRYGTMRENVLALTVVLADGRVIRTGTRAQEVGRGIRPDAAVRRIGGNARRHYRGDRPAASAARGHGRGGLLVRVDSRRCRHGDRDDPARHPHRAHRAAGRSEMDAVNRYSKTAYPVAPTLFFEFHGDSDRAVSEQAEAVQALAAERGGHGFEWAKRPEDRERLWQARHDVHYASLALRPGSRSWATDVCVPISRLADCVIETQGGSCRRAVSGLPGRPCRRRQLPRRST